MIVLQVRGQEFHLEEVNPTALVQFDGLASQSIADDSAVGSDVEVVALLDCLPHRGDGH